METKAFARRWLVTASAVGIVLLLWGAYRIKTPPKENDASPTVESSSLSIRYPVATLEPTPPSCPAEAQVRPRSGAELGRPFRGGLGSLRVENGTSLDAAAVLIDDVTDVPQRAIFIRSGESGSMTSVPTGRYRLRFQLGSDWVSERRFCGPVARHHRINRQKHR